MNPSLPTPALGRRPSVRRVLLALWPLALAATASAQAVAPKPAPDTIVLTPFSVDATKDVGFVAASALAGGRLTTDLKDTPVAYSVLTRDFIEALQLKDLTDAGKWVPNSNIIDDDGRQFQFGSGNAPRRTFRGVPGNTPQIDFFPAFYDYDSYNIERYDFARGPNSILFGNGSMGGTANALVKQARTDKSFGEVAVQVGSWNNLRGTLDVNRPVSRQLAVRVNALWQDAGSWREREYNDRLATALAVSYAPWAGGKIRATGEKGSYRVAIGIADWGDRFAGWDGTTTFSAPLLTVPGNAAATGIRRNGSPTAPYYVITPGLGNLNIMNWANTAVSLGGNESGAGLGGATLTTAATGYSGAPLSNRLNSPAGAFARAQAGSDFRVPSLKNSPKHDDETQRQDFENAILSFDQQFGRHLFVGAAANYSFNKIRTDYTVVRGLGDVFIDLNRNLPTGTSNPNFLHAYQEATRDFDILTFRAKSYRANAALVFDETRLGDFCFNAELGGRDQVDVRNKYRYSLQDPAKQAQDWLPTGDNLRYRYYMSDGARPLGSLPTSATVVDPVAGTTRSVAIGATLDTQADRGTSEFSYAQAVLQGRFFKKRLVVMAAARRDDYESGLLQRELRGSLPTTWDGRQVIHRPRAGADYFSLTYVPKSAAGVATGAAAPAVNRPRDANGRPQPQYANDKFQDDYSPPLVSDQLKTYSYGAVWHVIDAISLFGNYAETFNPPALDRRINGEIFPALISEGLDYGVRFNLLDGRVIVSAGRYAAKQANVRLGTGTGTGGIGIPLEGAFNGLALANVIGDQSAGGMNRRGMVIVPNNYADTADRKTSGYELELTANVTPAWRVLANYSTAKATQGNGYAETRAYIAANDALFRQIATDAGVAISASGVASVDQSVPVAQRSPDVYSAVAAYNNVQLAKANLTPVDQKVTRLAEATGNLFSDYTILSGRYKGVRFGGGFNYRGREVIGFRGGDTIVNPANAALAIDDPASDATTPVYRDPTWISMATFGYSFKVADRHPVRVDFTINNLLNSDTPLYYEVRQYAPDGNVASPARVATSARYANLVPRSYSLTVTVKF